MSYEPLLQIHKSLPPDPSPLTKLKFPGIICGPHGIRSDILLYIIQGLGIEIHIPKTIRGFALPLSICGIYEMFDKERIRKITFEHIMHDTLCRIHIDDDLVYRILFDALPMAYAVFLSLSTLVGTNIMCASDMDQRLTKYQMQHNLRHSLNIHITTTKSNSEDKFWTQVVQCINDAKCPYV